MKARPGENLTGAVLSVPDKARLSINELRALRGLPPLSDRGDEVRGPLGRFELTPDEVSRLDDGKGERKP